MIPEIDKFRSLFRDFARPNRFKVFFENITFIDTETLNKFTQLIKDITIFPVFTITNNQFKRMGKNINILNEVTSDGQIQIGFTIDEGMTPINVFKKWTNLKIHDWKNENNYPDKDAYDITLRVEQWNIDLKYKIMDFVFYNIKPVSLSGLSYSHDQNQSLLNCIINFVFSDYDLFPAENNSETSNLISENFINLNNFRFG